MAWLIAGKVVEQGAGGLVFFSFFFKKPFSKMERRNDFHDNNSIRERNEGSWRGNLKGRCHCREPGGGLGGGRGTEYKQNIKTQKPDYCS